MAPGSNSSSILILVSRRRYLNFALLCAPAGLFCKVYWCSRVAFSFSEVVIGERLGLTTGSAPAALPVPVAGHVNMARQLETQYY